MSNRLALVIVAVAVPVAGFFVSKKSSAPRKNEVATETGEPEKRDFSPIEQEEPEPVSETVQAPEPEPAPVQEPSRVRHDQKQLDRFSGKPIDEIIATLREQRKDEIEKAHAKLDPFHEALPLSPFPFDEESEPRDVELLKQYVETIAAGLIDEPNLLDRWRTSLAHIALGTFPDSVPEKYLIDNLLVSETPYFPVRFEIVGNFPSDETFAIADFTSDGRDDFIGKGGATFLKNFEGEPVNTELQAADHLYPADFDGDGDVDLFATRRAGVPNSLWVNEGDGKFVDFTESSGLLAFADTRAAAWADFDRDGKLDLAVGNYDAPLEVYRAIGDGTFEYVSDQWGLEEVTKVTGLTAADIDNDGTPDLYAEIEGEAPRVLRSTSEVTGLNWETLNSCQVFADFDNDGDLDVVIANISENPERAFVTTLIDDDIEALLVRFFQNDGEGKFTNVTTDLDLPDIAGATSLGAIDLDADGFLDLVIGTGAGIPNRIFWNRDGFGFREATAASGLGFLDSAEAVSTSTEGLIVNDKILNANTESPTLTVHLENNSLGAKIDIVTRDRDWVLNRFHRIANGFSPTVFGLGDARTIEKIEVVWPEEGTPPSSYDGNDVPLGANIGIERGGKAVIVLDE